jgi:predicted N-formylglutamate amidohydrolase
MIATHDQFTRHMRNRLKTTCMELGLVRLLQDAKRFEEARTTLHLLEDGYQGVESDTPSQESCKANRLKGVSRRFSFIALSANHEFVPAHN